MVAVGAGAATLAGPAQAVPVTQNSYPFPIRQIDLPSGNYVQVNWDHDGAGSRDYGVVRWDGSDWVSHKGDSLNSSDNNDYLIFGTPVFAPVDGTVVSCWRNHPENTGNTVHPGRAASPPTIIRSGNHINILTSDNKVMLLAHLQQQSIPADLCPIDTGNNPAGSFVTNADDKDGGDFPIEGVIPKALRPKVVQGQFLGRAGNTGASSGPHLHVHLTPIADPNTEPFNAGPTMPLNYHGIYTRPAPADGGSVNDWQPMQGAPMPGVDGTQVYASPFLKPMINLKQGAISEASAISLPGIGVVTASRSVLGNLEVATYGVNASDGEPILRDQKGADGASQIALARPGAGQDVVTAMRDASGNLRLIGWDVNPSGQLTRKGTATAGGATKVAVTPSPTSHPGLVTAVRQADGTLKLITWRVDNIAGKIERVSEATGVGVTDVAVTTVNRGRALGDGSSSSPNFRGVVTASRDTQGNLRLDSWTVTHDFKIVHAGQHVAGPVSRLSAATARSDANHDAVVTLVRDGAGEFRAIHWAVASGGGIARHGTTGGGSVQDVKLVATGQDVIGTMLVDGQVRLMTFRTYADGRITRDGENLPFVGNVGLVTPLLGLGPISSVTAPVFVSGRTYVLGLFGAKLVGLNDEVVSYRYAGAA